MQITRQQEIALWKLLANSLNLDDTGNNTFIGNCRFCGMEDAFVINTNLNYAGCLFCSNDNGSLVSNINRLMNSTSSFGK